MNFEEINEHLIQFEKVQSNINEVLRNQPDRRLIKIEVDAIIGGYQNYLEQHGFGGLELQLIMNKLEFNRLWVS